MTACFSIEKQCPTQRVSLTYWYPRRFIFSIEFTYHYASPGFLFASQLRSDIFQNTQDVTVDAKSSINQLSIFILVNLVWSYMALTRQCRW